jgi:hypothetical protein
MANMANCVFSFLYPSHKTKADLPSEPPKTKLAFNMIEHAQTNIHSSRKERRKEGRQNY